jgi:hypothetical protein
MPVSDDRARLGSRGSIAKRTRTASAGNLLAKARNEVSRAIGRILWQSAVNLTRNRQADASNNRGEPLRTYNL